MNWREDMAGESRELEQALDHFKASMDAWSDAALRRPRTVTNVAVRHNWRPAAGWALGCLLAAGSVAGAVHQIVHRQEMARMAAEQRAAEQQRQVREQQAREQDEDLLAKVDSDVSREVPSAMEPLAQLMAEDESK